MSRLGTVNTQLRLPRQLLEQAERLVPVLADHPAIFGYGRISKAAVIRLALAEGLKTLEQRYGSCE